MRERTAHLHQRTALGNIHIPNLHTCRGDLHAARSTNADCVLSHRPDRLHHADAHIKLRRRCHHSRVERVEQYGDYVYHSRCAVVHHSVGCDHLKRSFGDRQSSEFCRVRESVCYRDTHMYQRHTERVVYECFVYATDPNYANKFSFVSESHGFNPAGK